MTADGRAQDTAKTVHILDITRPKHRQVKSKDANIG